MILHNLATPTETDVFFFFSLQVSPTASEAQLKTAYKKGALKFHPGMCAVDPSSSHAGFLG